MTEEEAKSKWCPMVRVSFWFKITQEQQQPLAATVNRAGGHADVEKDCLCLGSGCAMWRRDDEASNGIIDHGYCGLAGKP